MNINFEYYKTFYYVAKHKNFTKAAEELLAGQPNVTRTIKTLEDQLGCVLFSRSKRKVELTPEGEKLFRHVQIAIDHIAWGEEELTSDKSLQDGAVSVGTSETALCGLLLPVLKNFRARYPKIKLKVGNYSTRQALAALCDGYVDFAVVTTPLDLSDRLSAVELMTFEEKAICGGGFSELKKGEVSLQIFSSYPVVGLGRSTKTYDYYSRQFALYGLKYRTDIEVATADQILPMVKSDLGVAFLPEFFLVEEKEVSRVKIKEKLSPRSICLVKQKGKSLSLAAKRLEEEIMEFTSDENR